MSGREFCIECGAEQVDVISPRLSARFEHALAEWKLRIHQSGWDAGTCTPLTRVWSAHDLIAKNFGRMALAVGGACRRTCFGGIEID